RLLKGFGDEGGKVLVALMLLGVTDGDDRLRPVGGRRSSPDESSELRRRQVMKIQLQWNGLKKEFEPMPRAFASDAELIEHFFLADTRDVAREFGAEPGKSELLKAAAHNGVNRELPD